MLAINYSTLRNNLKAYCDAVTDGYEAVIVTRKDENNVVLISLKEYKNLIKIAKNVEYLSMIDHSMVQIENGNIITKTMIELEELE